MLTVKGRYRVVGTLATSAEAFVYLADDLTSNRQVTLTVLRGEAATDAEFVDAVRDQANRLAKLANADMATPAVYECDVTDEGDLFVALEPLTGRSLREVLDARGALDPAGTLRLAIQIGEALETLHRHGVVHGALRPESILVVKDQNGAETVKVVGVELATARRTPLGIRQRDDSLVAYLAPEQLERGDMSEAADVHALGLMIQEFLTAQRPRATGPRLRPAEELPPVLWRIVARAVERRPEGRYSSVSLMVNDLWSAESEPPKVESPSVTHVLNERRATARRRARSDLGMAVALVVGLILVGVTAWVVRSDRLAGQPRTESADQPLAASPVGLPPSTPPVDAMPVQPPGPPALPAAMENPSTVVANPEGREPVDQSRLQPPRLPAAPAATEKTSPVVARPEGGDRAPAVAPPPRPVAKTPAPAAPLPAPVDQRGSDTGDGSAIIDWLLRNRRSD